MCGICGVVGVQGVSAEVPHLVRAMAATISHRGPDGEGFWDTPEGTLGHRRLAIIDVDNGSQPMFNADASTGIVFNGEIYNFVELRAQLEGYGYQFRTRSDTEVIVHGYDRWGSAVVERLRGMFAFALWNTRTRELLLARDRLGIKPLYYTFDSGSGRIAFASEIKALLCDPDIARAPNAARLAEYLVYRSVVGDETLFEGVRQLEPGTCLTLGAGGMRVRRYWHPGTQTPVAATDGRDPVRAGRALLQDAVESHLVSDVGIGTITSGGLDSSLVSAIAARAHPQTIDTFCVGFDDPALDERPYARQVADHIGSRHHDTVLTGERFVDRLEALTWMSDEPLSHPNAIGMHLVFDLARHSAGIPVLLSGEGADEVFGGYGWYRAALKRERVTALLGKRLTGSLRRRLLHGPKGEPLEHDYLFWANALGRFRGMLQHPHLRAAIADRGNSFFPADAGAAGLFIYDQLTYLQPLLQRQDRMSMAVGLEARVPFLDHPLVEWANGLSVRARIGNGRPKQLLRDIATPWLPVSVMQRRKVGFALPLADWMRSDGPLHERLRSVADPDSIACELLPRPDVERMIARHEAGEDMTGLLWTLLSVDEWARRFLTTTSTSPVTASVAI